jgi:hypothetical protein
MNPAQQSPQGYSSNASLSSGAKSLSSNAYAATAASKDSQPETHASAAEAHVQAAVANRAAGNESQAKEHDKLAKIHAEKSQTSNRAKMFAQDTAQDAEKLSAKAGKAKHGPDPDDPRGETDLHKDAANAHMRAASAFGMAGMDRDAAYHQAKAQKHLKKAGG